MDLPFRIPGTSEPEIIVRRSTFGGLTVLVDGTPVKGQRGRYPIQLPDGSIKELRLTGQWTGLKAVVDGVETPLEPPVPRSLLVLAFMPIALVAVGGLIGGAFGGVGVAVNTGVLRLQMGTPAKVLAMFGVTVVSVALFVVAALAFRNAVAPVQTLDVGMCVNGVAEGSVIARIDPVSCSTPHDNEVVGTTRYPEAGAYPGQAALETFAAPPCIAAFNAYVGVDFSSSSLDMLPILPTDATWASGDRAITCIVLARDRSKLTSSVKGAGV
jgi:putative regulator of septum formation